MAEADEEVPPVIIDVGSLTCRVGLKGDEDPRTVFPSVVGHLRREIVTESVVGKSSYVGEEALSKRGILNLVWPVEDGIVTNWDDMEKIFHHIFELNVDAKNHPVLLTESPSNPKANREKAIQCLFDTFGVPSVFIVSQPVASMFAAGRTTGVVLDVGASVGHVVPIYEGHCLRHAIRHVTSAGSHHSEYLLGLLKDRGYNSETLDMKTVDDIKEKLCAVARDFDRETANPRTITETFQLPDGHSITIDKERLLVPEVFFKPTLLGKDSPGIHRVIYDAVMDCDAELRKKLLAGVILAGGATMYRGLQERLQDELGTVVQPPARVKVIHPKKHSAWMGGSVLAAFAPIKQQWISKKEYECHGPSIVHKKCF
ncbi:actin-like [Diadema antillarum]|uniref:actin-like n=1 Tax=Diadema antillarum TaxID=105358 RepID=UPI003A840144